MVLAFAWLFRSPCFRGSWKEVFALRAFAAPIALLSWTFAALGLAHLLLDLSGHTRVPHLVARRVRALVEATDRHPMVVESAAGLAVFFALWGLFGWGESAPLFGSLAATLLAVTSVRRSLAPLLRLRARSMKVRRSRTSREVSLPIHARAYAASAPSRALGAVGLFIFLWATAGFVSSGRAPLMRHDIGLALFSIYFAVVVLGTLAGRSRVLIGIDGVLMRGVAGSSFFAFSEVASVERSGVSIVLRGPSVGALALHLDPFAQSHTEAVVKNLAWLALGAQGTEKHRGALERLERAVHYERARAGADILLAPRSYREPALRREDCLGDRGGVVRRRPRPPRGCHRPLPDAPTRRAAASRGHRLPMRGAGARRGDAARGGLTTLRAARIGRRGTSPRAAGRPSAGAPARAGRASSRAPS